MTKERRYQEDEVHEIFGAAAEAAATGHRTPSSGAGTGLTLSELQAIGGEVGLPPERIAEAALALDRRGTEHPRRSFLGMPIWVGRTIELARAPTDAEWELLVVELRSTFDAQGTVASHGRLREWTNGNLHVSVEPTETGQRLRMRTLKGDAVATTMAGISLTAMGLLFFIVFFLADKLAKGFFVPVLFGGMGVASLASVVLGLPRWAREREQQMEYMAARAQALIGMGPEAEATVPGDVTD